MPLQASSISFVFAWLGCVVACVSQGAAAFSEDIVNVDNTSAHFDLVIDASEAAGKQWSAVNCILGSLTVTLVNNDPAAPQIPIAIANITCPEAAGYPCVTIVASPASTQPVGVQLDMRDVFAPYAAQIDLNTSVVDSSLTLTNLANCTREGVMCVGLRVSAEASFTDSSFTFANTTFASYALSSAAPSSTSDLVVFSMEGMLYNVEVNFDRLKFALPNDNVLADPIIISGLVGLAGKTKFVKYAFSNMREIGWNVWGSLEFVSSFSATNNLGTVSRIAVWINVNFDHSSFTLDGNYYNTHFIGVSSTDGRGPKLIDGGIVYNSVRANLSNLVFFQPQRPSPFSAGVFFNNVSFIESSRVFMGGWGGGIQGQRLSLDIAGGSTVSRDTLIQVEDCKLDTVRIMGVTFDEKGCSAAYSCAIALNGIAAFRLMVSNVNMARYAAVILSNFSPIWTSEALNFKAVTGTGLVSIINSDFKVSADLSGFAGHFEMWGNTQPYASRVNSSITLESFPIPSRLTLSSGFAPLLLGGALVENATIFETVLAVMDFGCVGIQLPNNTLLNGTVVPCEALNTLRRCDEGLSFFDKQTLATGYRDEYVVRNAIETCLNEQQDAPPAPTTTSPTDDEPTNATEEPATTATAVPPTEAPDDDKKKEELNTTIVAIVVVAAIGGLAVIIVGALLIISRCGGSRKAMESSQNGAGETQLLVTNY